MLINWRYLLAGAAAAFLLFLVIKMRPSLPFRGHASEELKKARARAKEATSPRAKAEALCEVGVIAARTALPLVATGYFLRAMRADPSWPGAIERAAAAFHKRPRLLERFLWRRLAELPWDDQHRDVLRAVAYALRDVYDSVRDRPRAEFMNRFAAKLDP
jgi:hypothetical protein